MFNLYCTDVYELQEENIYIDTSSLEILKYLSGPLEKNMLALCGKWTRIIELTLLCEINMDMKVFLIAELLCSVIPSSGVKNVLMDI